jgi:hypothetical protein
VRLALVAELAARPEARDRRGQQAPVAEDPDVVPGQLAHARREVARVGHRDGERAAHLTLGDQRRRLGGDAARRAGPGDQPVAVGRAQLDGHDAARPADQLPHPCLDAAARGERRVQLGVRGDLPQSGLGGGG